MQVISDRPLPAQLQRALEYENSALIAQAVAEMHTSEEYVRDLFFELRHYFFLCFEEGRLPTPVRIDNLWHVFYSREDEYRAFCLACFGGFIEHIPHAHPPERGVTTTIDAAHRRFGSRLANHWQGETRCDGLYKAAA